MVAVRRRTHRRTGPELTTRPQPTALRPTTARSRPDPRAPRTRLEPGLAPATRAARRPARVVVARGQRGRRRPPGPSGTTTSPSTNRPPGASTARDPREQIALAPSASRWWTHRALATRSNGPRAAGSSSRPTRSERSTRLGAAAASAAGAAEHRRRSRRSRPAQRPGWRAEQRVGRSPRCPSRARGSAARRVAAGRRPPRPGTRRRRGCRPGSSSA